MAKLCDVREIDEIQFGIYSADEILAHSVCKIDSSKHVGPGSVYDPLMGTTDRRKECKTCSETAELCPGHIGHIELNEPIIHPLFYLRVESFLRCICIKCNRFLIDRDQLFLNDLNKYKGETRFTHILEYLKKIDICCQKDCGTDQPIFKYSSIDNTISMVYVQNKVKTSIILTVEEIKKIFDNFPDEDVELLGFNPSVTKPSNFILTILPVLPPADRPFVKSEGNIGDDDLTVQYLNIIKQNNYLSDTTLTEKKRQTHINSLKFHILTLFDNSRGKAKHTTNSRALKGIKERFTSKDGLIRNNMLGKRCDYSGRTVIGADPTLKFDELAVPQEMASNLTIPVKVTEFNIDYLTSLINSGKVNFVEETKTNTIRNMSRMLNQSGEQLLSDDIIIRPGPSTRTDGEDGGIPCTLEAIIAAKDTLHIPVKTGKEVLRKGDIIKRGKDLLTNIKFPITRVYNRLKLGDIAHRQLQNGDYVLLNRQPTLHKASMQAMKVVVRPYKTLRMNLAITKPFNADFDFNADF